MRRRYRSFRGEIGSILYRIVYAALLYLGFKIFGVSIFDDLIFLLIGVLAFEIVGLILRGTRHHRR